MKKETVILIVAVMLIISLPAVADWPMHQHGPDHNGFTTEPGPLHDWQLWDWALATTNQARGGTVPVVADDRVFTVVIELLDTSPYSYEIDGQMLCLDAATGEEIWHYYAGGNQDIGAWPAISGDRVYITTTWRPDSYNSDRSTIRCLDRQTGSEVWGWSTQSNATFSSPVVDDGVVLVTAYCNIYYFNEYWTALFAIDATSGELLWGVTSELNKPLLWPSIHDGRVFTGIRNEGLYCLDLQTGATVWEKPMDPLTSMVPTVAGDMVLYQANGSLMALDRLTGVTLWERPGVSGSNSVAAAAGKIYHVADDGTVTAFDQDTGNPAWVRDITADLIWDDPVVAGEALYVPDSEAMLHCIDIHTGDPIWSGQVGDVYLAAPAISDGRLYITDYFGRLCCYGTPDTSDAGLTCLPDSGTLPFTSVFTVSVTNQYTEQTRRFDYAIKVTLASGQSYTNWRRGYHNVARGETYTRAWTQSIPAYGTLVGVNVFDLAVLDITPEPYNQPPYPPAGDTATDSCSITATLP